MKRVIFVSGALALGLVVAGCSSSGGSGSTAGSGSGSGAGSASVNGSAGSGGAASGKPLNVFFFNEEGASAAASSPESFQAASAAADYVNKELGGVNGRPIKLTHCATLGTPASATDCANQAVDAKPDVVIKGVDVAGGTAVPIVTGAGLAYVTANAGQPVEVNTDGAFSLTAGFAAQFASVPQYAKDKGYKSIGVIYTNVSALSTPLEGPIKKLAAKEGLAYYTSPVDITSGDLTPAYSALLSKHVDALLVVTSQGQCAATLKARQSLADTTPLLMSSSCNVTSVLNTVPASVTNGTLFALLDTSAVPDDPDTKIYEAKMKAYQPKAQLGGFAPSSFEEIMDLYAALKKVPDSSTLNATTVKTALKQSTDVPLFMGGGKTFSCSKVWFEGSPSVCTGTAFLVSYSNGTYTDAGAFDAADLLKGI